MIRHFIPVPLFFSTSFMRKMEGGREGLRSVFSGVVVRLERGGEQPEEDGEGAKEGEGH